ncbi:conserved hypothetical protein [Ricinus communis]|uniref:Alcohol dehydrogenase n=1 Tax=Ricinus communis TaxID=3988 RepID=B9S261_RICCO|nr:conserved hypothetical protein [Ricinus communis]
MKEKAFGMTDFINPHESAKSISQLVKDVAGEVGVDYCFECTGAASLANQPLQATKMAYGV